MRVAAKRKRMNCRMKDDSIFLNVSRLVVLVVSSVFLSAPPPNCELPVCEIRFASFFLWRCDKIIWYYYVQCQRETLF